MKVSFKELTLLEGDTLNEVLGLGLNQANTIADKVVSIVTEKFPDGYSLIDALHVIKQEAKSIQEFVSCLIAVSIHFGRIAVSQEFQEQQLNQAFLQNAQNCRKEDIN